MIPLHDSTINSTYYRQYVHDTNTILLLLATINNYICSM